MGTRTGIKPTEPRRSDRTRLFTGVGLISSVPALAVFALTLALALDGSNDRHRDSSDAFRDAALGLWFAIYTWLIFAGVILLVVWVRSIRATRSSNPLRSIPTDP